VALESRGVLYVARPDLLRWEYTDGSRQVVIGDGRWLWVYQPELEQVWRSSYQQAVERAPLLDFLATGTALSTAYRVLEESVRGDRLTVKLEARKGPPIEIELTLDAGSLDPLGLLVRQPDGGWMSLELAGALRNQDLDPSLFSFTPPAGTDIITVP
jgi:chaperone LolA